LLALAYRSFDPAGDHQLSHTTFLKRCQRLSEARDNAVRASGAEDGVHPGCLVVALPASERRLHSRIQRGRGELREVLREGRDTQSQRRGQSGRHGIDHRAWPYQQHRSQIVPVGPLLES
jgi:hypothetical protein